MTYTFRACWPITDITTGIATLCAHATNDLPLLLAQAHATPTGGGRWSVADSTHVPGSGRITRFVLLYECPAVRRTPRRTPTLHALPTPTPTTEPTSTTTSTGAAA